ncbi:MAG TPA: type II toxin-antitoxin system PemK/MazF family toxin, partial [Nocardioides sp.]|nr:type II toxin-antitoxin system PemK/MazF family toxin [Nocardioides sp.]
MGVRSSLGGQEGVRPITPRQQPDVARCPHGLRRRRPAHGRGIAGRHVVVGHGQHGDRFGVVVQANEFLARSVVIVVPTSRSARPASFRPEIDIAGERTRVLV